MRQYLATQKLPVSAEAAFKYHAAPGALNRLIPPWESVKIESSDQSLESGSRVVLRTSIAGLPVRWVAEHTDYEPPNLFCDKQISGPFAQWNHQHSFHEKEESGSPLQSHLTDQIDYKVPFGLVGDTLGGGIAKRTIEAMFAYRHRVTHDDLNLQSRYSNESLKVAISGSNGLVGQSLSTMLSLFGHVVQPIVRGNTHSNNEIAAWSDTADDQSFAETDVVVHLAGKSIASGRWTKQQKKEIRDSRVKKTRKLCELLAKTKQPPKTLICASATGVYGDRGDEALDEQSCFGDATETGSGFLVDVGRQWEEACRPAIEAGIRVVNARFGIILSPQGGALQKMLTPAKLLGGSLGSGKQWWSWIALDDAIGAIYHCIKTEQLHGPVNLVSPHPIQNKVFAKQLGQVLGRPAIFPAPAPMLRIALGEMADALLLSSTRVTPMRLIESGYEFRFSDLKEVLSYSLGRTTKPSASRTEVA